MVRTRRGYLFATCLVVLVGAAALSAALATDEMRDHTTRTLGLCGLALFSLLAGSAVAQWLKPWMRARAAAVPTRRVT
jgi:hypothetical protein